MPRNKSAEHKRLTGRRPGLDCAGKRLPATVVALSVDGAPVAPVSMSEVGRAHWERIWSAPWVRPNYDAAAVVRLCELYEDREAMRASIREWGLMLPASAAAGGGRSNPMIDKLMKGDSELRKLEVEFGMTPAARAKLGLTEVSRQSRLDEMMRRQREA